jgi:hypothetical protein
MSNVAMPFRDVVIKPLNGESIHATTCFVYAGENPPPHIAKLAKFHIRLGMLENSHLATDEITCSLPDATLSNAALVEDQGSTTLVIEGDFPNMWSPCGQL